MTAARTVLAIDLGTQSLRLTLMSATGDSLWSYIRPIASRVGAGIQEQDAAEWREYVIAGLDSASKHNIVPDAIVACGPLAGFVPLGLEGEILGAAVLYNDVRSERFLGIVGDGVDREAPRNTIADPLPHALRLRSDERTTFAAMRHFLDATGFLNFVLCGEATLNAYTALRLDPARRAQLGLDAVPFGRRVETGQIIGTLRAELAASLGWPALPIVAAPFDSKCAYLGSGISRPGDALDISGTVTSFGVVAERRIADAGQRIYSVPFGSSWLVRGSTAASGSVIEWARSLLGIDVETFDALAVGEIGGNDALVVPFHAGARAPLWQPHARGLAVGIDLATDRSALARGTYLGLALSLRHIVETIESNGAAIRTLFLAGGLAKSPVLSQFKADMLGRPVIALSQTELTTAGLAAIGATALGLYPSLSDAAVAFAKGGVPYMPRLAPDAADQLYRRYLDAAAFAASSQHREPSACQQSACEPIKC